MRSLPPAAPLAPHFPIPRGHPWRDAAMVAFWLAIVGGFLAQVSAVPPRPAADRPATFLAARLPAGGSAGLARFAGGAPAAYPPCAAPTYP